MHVDLEAAGALFDPLWKVIRALYWQWEEPVDVNPLLKQFEQIAKRRTEVLNFYFSAFSALSGTPSSVHQSR